MIDAGGCEVVRVDVVDSRHHRELVLPSARDDGATEISGIRRHRDPSGAPEPPAVTMPHAHKPEPSAVPEPLAAIARAWMPSADALSIDTLLMEVDMTSVMMPRSIKVRTPRHRAATAQDASALARPDFTTALDRRCTQELAAVAGTQLPSTLLFEHATVRAADVIGGEFDKRVRTVGARPIPT